MTPTYDGLYHLAGPEPWPGADGRTWDLGHSFEIDGTLLRASSARWDANRADWSVTLLLEGFADPDGAMQVELWAKELDRLAPGEPLA